MDVNQIYAITLLLLTLTLIISVEFIRKKKYDFLFIFNLTYLILFCVIPITIIINPSLLYFDIPANWAYHFEYYQHQLVSASVYVFVFYIFFILSYYLFNKRSFVNGKTKEKLLSINNDVIYRLGVLFLIIGIVSFFVYSMSMGGPISAITNAQLKRSGVYESGAFSFFKHFMKSVYFSLFIFMTIKPKNKFLRVNSKILLVTSFIFTIIVLLAYSGRANIVIMIMVIFFYKNILNNKILQKKTHLFKYLTFVLLFGVIAAFFRPFMLLISGREIVFEGADALIQILSAIVKSLSVPFISLMVALNQFSFNDISLGLGFLQVFTDIIPSQLFSIDNGFLINNLNTELFGYQLDSRNYNINAGLLAYFYYEFYWFGMILGGLITALFLKFANDFFRVLIGHKTFGIIMVYFMFNVPHRIIAGDQVNGFKSFLILIIEFLILYYYVKYTRIKKANRVHKGGLNENLT